ncbi:hypothetical protein CLV24_11553 [Pontibacter ummariensis]|uniref:Uncharacterized protein n=1 Tax=Pontibacter ummariensis TaxID=1610492 RepID=A0A239HZH6_9BACT|nr:hypothetical protein [Pontibacter ummariensis]PRY10136.1 hypothetical protein CLV24_11553 [Pontibacter ummariensis]SNS86671.1 hypothetical protein SAMN06296052_11553 [Pontibacter ummariensis]
MKKLYTLLFLLLYASPLFAQYETVVFNYDRAYFNEGQPLPAESNLMLTGEVGRNIRLVELAIYRTADTSKEPLYTNIWKARGANTDKQFVLPVNYPLRGNEKYTLVLSYYAPASIRQKRQLLRQLTSALDAYIDQSFEVSRSSVELRQHPKKLRSDLNAIVNQGLGLYRNQIDYDFRGFSDIVLDKLEQLDELRLRKAKLNILAREDDDNRTVRLKYAQEQIEALKEMVNQELVQYANTRLLVLVDRKKITDYATEKTKNVLALNLGYGGVYYSGDTDNLSSDTAPYAGISIPLGRAAFSSTFWSRSSISTGVFLKNLDFGDDNVATGPVVKRPVYVALGYRALPFVRINAGATVLQSDQGSNSISDFNVDRVYVRPFIGLSLELNLWMDLNR